MPDYEITEAFSVGRDAQFLESQKLKAATGLAESVCATHQRLWASRNPPAVIALYGANAAALFIHHAQAVTFISSINPDLIPEQYRAVPAEWVVTLNEDGTATVTPAE